MTCMITSSVGAGSARCVLANRLSRDGKKRVCLIEAGPPDKNLFIHMPMGLAAIARNARSNWAYLTETAARAWQPPALLAAWENTRRLELDQRHDLHARPQGGLSGLGGGCGRCVGLGACGASSSSRWRTIATSMTNIMAPEANWPSPICAT